MPSSGVKEQGVGISFVFFEDSDRLHVVVYPRVRYDGPVHESQVFYRGEHTMLYSVGDADRYCVKRCSTWEREAYVMSLGVEGVVELVGCDPHRGEVWMPMYATNMYQYCRQSRPALGELLGLLSWLLRVLLDLYDRAGISHLDIKPENIVRDDVKGLALIDFSLSKHTPPGRRGGGRYHRCGTPGFMPPEIKLRPRAQRYFYSEDVRMCDVYSSAMVFVDLWLGRNNQNTPRLLRVTREGVLRGLVRTPSFFLAGSGAHRDALVRCVASALRPDPRRRLNMVSFSALADRLLLEHREGRRPGRCAPGVCSACVVA